MKAIKSTILSLALAGIGFTVAPTTAQAAGVFNSAISNPFVFCSLPKPCKYCQPFRRIYETICPAGQPSAEAKQEFQNAVAANPALAATAITPEQFKAQLTPAIKSAYDDSISEAEIQQYIYWLGQQPVPAGTVINRTYQMVNNDSCNSTVSTMSDYWCYKGINPFADQSIRDKALNIIKQTNEKIVASISTGTIPQNPKPWFGISVLGSNR